jgi:hypothetical protein
MTKKRTPAPERHRETTTSRSAPSELMVVDNRPDTEPGCPGRDSGLTWSGEPVRNDDEAIFRTKGQVRRDADPGRRGERTRGRLLGLASGQLAPGRARGTSIAPTDLHGVCGGGPREGPLVAEVDARFPLKRVGERAAGDRAQRRSPDGRRGWRGRADPRGQACAGRRRTRFRSRHGSPGGSSPEVWSSTRTRRASSASMRALTLSGSTSAALASSR